MATAVTPAAMLAHRTHGFLGSFSFEGVDGDAGVVPGLGAPQALQNFAVGLLIVWHL